MCAIALYLDFLDFQNSTIFMLRNLKFIHELSNVDKGADICKMR